MDRTHPHPGTVSASDLADLVGYSRPADIERWCEANGVRYFRGRVGIWTTVEALNSALGLTVGQKESAFPPRKLEF